MLFRSEYLLSFISEKTLIALFDWCKVNVKSVYVLIADEIQMYTFMASKGLERKEACAKALQIGDIKYRFIELSRKVTMTMFDCFLGKR